MSRRTKKQELTVVTVNGAAQVTPLLSAESRSRLGDLLLSDQSVLPEQLAEALNLQQESGRRLARCGCQKRDPATPESRSC